MTIVAEIKPGELADLVQKVLAGDEILFTQGQRPVAKLIQASEEAKTPRSNFTIRSISGHQVLTPNISQEELADEMFSRP
jgi:antitoxin (DNA-binding transcriptional repressor) of toxin-antitoxin stability system